MRADYALAYGDLYRTHWWWRAREEFLLEELRRNLPRKRGNRILDIGCGAGLFFGALEEFGDVRGVELDVSLKTGDPSIDERIFWGRLEDYQPTVPFSLVLLLDVLEHLDDPASLLRRAVSLLDPGGMLVATVPAFQALWTSHDEINEHVARYTKRTFGELLGKADCTVELLQYFFAWTFPAKLAVRLIEAVRHPSPQNSLPKVPPHAINRTLYRLSRMEQRLLGDCAPVGSSLLAVARKPSNGESTR